MGDMFKKEDELRAWRESLMGREGGHCLDSPAEVFARAWEKCPCLPKGTYLFADFLASQYLIGVEKVYPSDLILLIADTLLYVYDEEHQNRGDLEQRFGAQKQGEILAQASLILQVLDAATEPAYADLVRKMAYVAFGWRVPYRIWIEEDDPDDRRRNYGPYAAVAADWWTAILQYPAGSLYGHNQYLRVPNPLRLEKSKIIQRFCETGYYEVPSGRVVFVKHQILGFRNSLMRGIAEEILERGEAFLAVSSSYECLFGPLADAAWFLGDQVNLLPCQTSMHITREEITLTVGENGPTKTVWRAK